MAVSAICFAGFIACIAIEVAIIRSMRPKYKEGSDPKERE